MPLLGTGSLAEVPGPGVDTGGTADEPRSAACIGCALAFAAVGCEAAALGAVTPGFDRSTGASVATEALPAAPLGCAAVSTFGVVPPAHPTNSTIANETTLAEFSGGLSLNLSSRVCIL
jgi:hypothetical protein